MKRGDAGGASRAPRAVRACACACACAAAAAVCAVPWLTLLSVLAGAAGIGMFDSRARVALDKANVASQVIAGNGLHDWVILALRCVTAATVLFSIMLPFSLLAVAASSRSLRAARTPSGARPRPSCARAAFVYTASAYAYLVALALVAMLAAAVTGTVGAKGAELVANYGATLTNQVADIGNDLAGRAAPLATLLSGGSTAVELPPTATCPAECFNAARYPFLNSKRCVCGRELFTFRDNMAETFDVAVVGVVGAGIASAAAVLLWGATVAHAARVWQLRCRTNGGHGHGGCCGGASSSGDDSERGEPRGDDTSAESSPKDDDATVVHVAEWPPKLLPSTGVAPAPAAAAAALCARGTGWWPSAQQQQAQPASGTHARTHSL